MNATSRPPRREINVVAVCYQRPADRVAVGLQRIAQHHGVALRGVIVCNRSQQVQVRLQDSRFDLIQGSNALLDFSGFFEGMERLLSTRSEAASSNILFVNDTLFTKHAASCILGRVLDLDVFLERLSAPAISGKLDPYRAICMRNPWSGHSGYITSFCFLLNSLALPLMRQLPADAHIDGLLGDAEVGDLGWGSQLPHDLREMLRAHLLYPGSPLLWPAARSSNSDLLRRKAASSYFEHRLSGHLGKSGVVVPINAGPRSIASVALNERMARLSRAIGAKLGVSS